MACVCLLLLFMRIILFTKVCRVGVAQLIRFLVVKLTHLSSNPEFVMGVIFTANYFFSGRRRPRRQRGALGDRLHESEDQAGSIFQTCS
jgi:hypothetical protein